MCCRDPDESEFIRQQAEEARDLAADLQKSPAYPVVLSAAAARLAGYCTQVSDFEMADEMASLVGQLRRTAGDNWHGSRALRKTQTFARDLRPPTVCRSCTSAAMDQNVHRPRRQYQRHDADPTRAARTRYASARSTYGE